MRWHLLKAGEFNAEKWVFSCKQVCFIGRTFECEVLRVRTRIYRLGGLKFKGKTEKMLRIKRVPTVVSNYQKEETEEGARRSSRGGRNCLNKCCLKEASFPLYLFQERQQD